MRLVDNDTGRLDQKLLAQLKGWLVVVSESDLTPQPSPTGKQMKQQGFLIEEIDRSQEG